jgi:hypothetical protein
MLPSHGRIACTRCFPASQSLIEIGEWQVRNDPGAWGSANPSVLVLGFSKGATQVNIYQKGNFDDVAFGGRSRANLTAILQCIWLLKPEEHVDEKIKKDETEFAFGSLVRCSLARWNAKKSTYETSGALIKKSFAEVHSILHTCTQAFLHPLPDRTRLIVMLGVDDGYIRECQKLIHKLYPANFRVINEVAYGTPQHIWVHLTHPSPGNGTRNQWLSGPVNSTSGRKRELALIAILDNGLARA